MGTRTIDGKTYQEVVYPDGYEVPLSLEGASITIGTSVEVSNDSGNPLPVSDAGGSLTVDDGGGSITVDGPLTNTELRASAITTAPNITRGGGALDSNTTRVTMATDGPMVTAVGTTDQSAATTDTGTFSIIQFLKRGMQNWASLLAKVPTLTLSGTRLLVDGSGVLQPVNGRAYASTTSITRPANTTAYTAGDVVGTTSSAIHQLTSVGPSGGMVLVQSVELLLGVSAVPSGMSSFRLHFYSASPTAISDNAAFNLVAGDRSSYLGYVDIGTPSDLGDTCWVQADYSGRELKLASGQTSLWCQLQTIGGFTPAANSEVYELRVKTLEVGV